jgi:hypothetical protein
MTKPIATMSDKQLDQELDNFERYRTSKVPAHRKLFEAKRPRYEDLLAAKEARSGLKLANSLTVIESAAKLRKFICYKDLADASGVEWTRARLMIFSHLWDLVSVSHEQFGFMISAVVVNKQRIETGEMDKETLDGFVRAAERLGFDVTQPEQLLRDQQEAIFAHFAGH